MSQIWQERQYTVPINISASGDNIVANCASPALGDMPTAWDNPATYMAVDFVSFIPNASVTVTFNSGTAAGGSQTAISGPMNLATAQTVTWENSPQNEHGVLHCAPNQPLVLTLSSAVQVSGMLRVRLMATN